MTISNVGTLQTAVESWVERTLTDSLFLEFCTNVTDRLERGGKTPDGRAWVSQPIRIRSMLYTTTMNSSTGEITDWLEFSRVAIEDGENDRELKFVTPLEFSSSPLAVVNDKPLIYTIDGTTFRAAPTQATTLAVTYYQRLSPLTADASTNAVLTNHPRVYLHGCIAETCEWLADYERADREWAKFGAAVAGLNAEFKQAQTRGAIMRARPRAVV